MGTEKFIAFKEDGTAYRLKGRILRFLDNEPVSEDDKTNIRSTLSVPASGEGLTPANNLSDLSNVATARTNLEVNSKDEDAQANGTKVTAPALYFNGSSSVVTVADDDKLSFTDSVNDLPFTVSAFVNMTDASSFSVVGKHGTSASVREWLFGTNSNDDLIMDVRNTSGNYQQIRTDAALTAYEGQWIHVAASYAGAGPSAGSGVAFTAATSAMTLYVNGQAVASSSATSGTYTGMANTAQALWAGRSSTQYAKGSIRDVKIFNRSLTASEIAELARGNDLGFSEEWAGANGGVYTSDFSNPDVGGDEDLDGWTGTARGTIDGNIDSIGGKNDNLRFTSDTTTGTHYTTRGSVFTPGKRHRVEFDYYIPSSNSNIDGFRIYNGTTDFFVNEYSATLDAWTRFSAEVVVGVSAVLYIEFRDGGVVTFTDAGGDDVAYFRNIKISEIGCLASFSAERYDTSTSKLYDISDNAFVGTGTSISLTGREVPVYETGTWTPSITLGGGATGVTYLEQGGYFTRVGDICFVRGIVFLSNKGTDTGALKIVGLPFTSSSAGSNTSLISIYMTAAAGLTSNVVGLIDDGGTGITISDFGATGATTIDDTNLSNTTIIRFSGTYQIQ